MVVVLVGLICVPGVFVAERVLLSFTTGSIGGIFYPVGGGIANLLVKEFPKQYAQKIRIAAETSAGSLVNRISFINLEVNRMGMKKKEKKSLLRREFFKQSGILATGIGVGAVGLSVASRAEGQEQVKVPEWPWPYATLDVEKVRKQAHLMYYENACMYGVFNSIVSALVDKVGYPYNLIPTKMMQYGEGGVVGWGSLCGAINGACATIALIAGEEYKKLAHELIGWYTETAFPSDIANEYAKNHAFLVEEYKSDLVLPQSVSGSTLCHVSVSKWCKASGYASGSSERSERCGRLTGDVAARAVELLNDHAAGQFVPVYATEVECRSCHFKGKSYETGQFTRGKETNCVECHGEPHK